MRELSEEQTEHLKKKYVALCCQPRVHAIRMTEDYIQNLESRAHEYQNLLIETIRAIEFKKEELKGLKTIPDMKSKEIELKNLLTHPDIENIVIEDNRITVYTSNIEIEHDNCVYSMGKFIIYLSSGSTRGNIIKYQGTSSHHGHPHPHINDDGQPCLGNIQECLPAMIAAYQYVAAVSVAIQYLKSYTQDGDGRPFTSIENWPRRMKQG
jgi:hypothetical protein